MNKDSGQTPNVNAFFDSDSNTVTYVVSDPSTRACAIIDPVLDYDAAAGRTHHESADRVVAYVRDNDLSVQWIIETHVHADHLSSAPYIKSQVGGRLAIGERITEVQSVFGKLFNTDNTFSFDGRQFDHLFADNEVLELGNIKGFVMHTPGHTPACATVVIGDAAFVGDTMFMPDYGTARADFPGGDARVLYQSIRRVLDLPPSTRLFMCHDYKAPGRDDYAWETTVAAQRSGNVHVRDGVTEEEYVVMREARDATLSMPRLIIPSVQVNMRAGELPAAESNGIQYLKVPINAL
jgi:glyoxylase-like metal-dependent hydrolase (beta-lactamase superfamily II)